MKNPSIELHGSKLESVKRFHPWIFSGAIKTQTNELTEGQVVDVFDNRNHFLARGHFQPSTIAVRVLTFEDIIEISAQKHKEHVVYSRVVFEMERLENNYRIMDLGNPLMDDVEKEYIEDVVEESTPTLNTQAFLLLYNEDGIGHMIKNPEFTINDTYKVLNSFTK
jgi:hypothetical protein